MELAKFKGTLYGKVNSQLFIWEESWDSFRPIENIGWNGKELVAVDTKYKTDIFDPYYGYGSAEMKEVCKRLTEITELNVPESSIPWLKGEWWRDRNCTFAFECSPKTVESWKKYITYMNSRAKTLRKMPSKHVTRRKL
jgi:hypothetical protein